MHTITYTDSPYAGWWVVTWTIMSIDGQHYFFGCDADIEVQLLYRPPRTADTR